MPVRRWTLNARIQKFGLNDLQIGNFENELTLTYWPTRLAGDLSIRIWVVIWAFTSLHTRSNSLNYPKLFNSSICKSNKNTIRRWPKNDLTGIVPRVRRWNRLKWTIRWTLCRQIVSECSKRCFQSRTKERPDGAKLAQNQHHKRTGCHSVSLTAQFSSFCLGENLSQKWRCPCSALQSTIQFTRLKINEEKIWPQNCENQLIWSN